MRCGTVAWPEHCKTIHPYVVAKVHLCDPSANRDVVLEVNPDQVKSDAGNKTPVMTGGRSVFEHRMIRDRISGNYTSGFLSS